MPSLQGVMLTRPVRQERSERMNCQSAKKCRKKIEGAAQGEFTPEGSKRHPFPRGLSWYPNAPRLTQPRCGLALQGIARLPELGERREAVRSEQILVVGKLLWLRQQVHAIPGT